VNGIATTFLGDQQNHRRTERDRPPQPRREGWSQLDGDRAGGMGDRPVMNGTGVDEPGAGGDARGDVVGRE
jgi:hypothetical protein